MSDGDGTPNHKGIPQNDNFIDVENRLRLERNRRLKPRSISRQRVGVLTRVLKHRHGDACLTDDAEIWFDLVAPFQVDVALSEGREPAAIVLRWCKRFLPAFAEDVGTSEMVTRVNTLAAAWAMAKQSKKLPAWFPSMAYMVETLQLRFVEVVELGLRGWGSIDPASPEEKKARDRVRKQAKRRAAGIRPQSERTRTKEDAALAGCLERSLRTIKQRRVNGTLDALIRERIEADGTDCTKVSASSLKGEYGTDTNMQLLPSMNDDDIDCAA